MALQYAISLINTRLDAIETALGTAATQVTHLHNQGIALTFHNAAKSGQNLIYLGVQTVSTASGLHIDADGYLQIEIGPGQAIYAVSNPAGVVLEVLEQRM